MKKVTTLLAMLLTATITTAQETSLDFSREKPTPVWNTEETNLPIDKTVYMLNVESGQFFLGANDWNTQASVSDAGWKVKLSKHLDTKGTWDGETVVINDSVESKGRWMKVGCDINQGPVCWTDFTTNSDTLWTIRKVGTHYRISASAQNPSAHIYSGKFAGVNLSEGNTRIYLNLTEEANNHIDWQFILAEDYLAYQHELQLFHAAEALKSLIIEATDKGIDMSTALTVYTNTASTAEEIEAATISVKEALADYDEVHVTVENPVDKTSFIINPNYEEDATGWNDTNADLAVKHHVVEHYDDIFNHSQSIKQIPAGVYALTVQAFYRPVSAGSAMLRYLDGHTHAARIFAGTASEIQTTKVHNIWAGASETPLGIGAESKEADENGKQWYVPNDMRAAEAYLADSKLGEKYDCTLFFGVGEGDFMHIGIELDSLIGDDWVLWDNWRLTYYGNQEEAYRLWLEEVKKNTPRYDDEFVTKGLLDAYNQSLETVTGNDYATTLAAVKSIQKQAAELEANKEIWAEYLQCTKEAKAIVSDENIYWNAPLRKLDDYLTEELPTIIEERNLTNEELQQDIKLIKSLSAQTPIVHINKRVWSYVSFSRVPGDNAGEVEETNSYTRYTTIGYTNIDRVTYTRLAAHTTCEYEEGQEEAIYRIRMEDNRIYLLKEDAPEYDGIILKEEGNDYILYDFNLKAGDEFCKLTYNGTDTVSVIVEETSTVTTIDGETFNTWKLSEGVGEWIEGYGSTISFLYPLTHILPTCDCGTSLNYAYWTDYHQTITYKNPFENITAINTAFKENDCALTGVETVEEKEATATSLRVSAQGETITCLSHTATQLEVYTLDAMKVGEARFLNGKAIVTVSHTPATYLYIVTYPNGRRESGKVVASK